MCELHTKSGRQRVDLSGLAALAIWTLPTLLSDFTLVKTECGVPTYFTSA